MRFYEIYCLLYASALHQYIFCEGINMVKLSFRFAIYDGDYLDWYGPVYTYLLVYVASCMHITVSIFTDWSDSYNENISDYILIFNFSIYSIYSI